MKLSDAIEKGSQLIRQARGLFLSRNLDNTWHGCALGAAAVGEYGLPGSRPLEYYQIQLEKDHQELLFREVLFDTGPQLKLRQAIVKLNDGKGKTFKQIIEWLREQDL
jgi:hypothetical protein